MTWDWRTSTVKAEKLGQCFLKRGKLRVDIIILYTILRGIARRDVRKLVSNTRTNGQALRKGNEEKLKEARAQGI